MRRRAGTILLALLAAGGLSAAKPPMPPADGGVQYTSAPLAPQVWRSRVVPVCVARLSVNRALTPDDLETICGCTVDTYLEGHGSNPLPGLAADHLPIALENDLLSCTTRTRPDQRTAVRQLNMFYPQGQPAPVAPPPSMADGSKPVDEFAEPPVTGSGGDSGGDSSGGFFWEWLRNLSWPAWLTGASVLWWVAIGIFLFGLLVLKIRRRDPRNDLMGPPGHMRRGAPPQPPRRPDLPR